MDQKDIVDERQQNIKEIADMMNKVNQISKEMNQLIHKQDEGLDEINKKQKKIKENAEKATENLIEADDLTKKKLKKIAIWAVAVILLGLCIVGLVYILKGGGGGKKDDPKVVKFGNEFGNNIIHKHIHEHHHYYHGFDDNLVKNKSLIGTNLDLNDVLPEYKYVVHSSLI